MNADPTASALWDCLPERSRALCREVARIAEARGEAAYLVGGAVRDLLLGASRVDLDLVVEGDAAAVAAAAARELGGALRTPSEFLTTAIELPDGGHVDVATARQESYPAPTKLPVVQPATINEDLRRRDFSVNAMALCLGESGAVELIDPCGGRADLAAGLIRVLHDRSFDDDPTRIIRAVRFEQRLRFALEGMTKRRLRDAVEAGRLEQVTGARVRDEVAKLLNEPDPRRALRRLQDLGALERALPGAQLDEAALARLAEAPAALAALGERVSAERRWAYLLGAICASGSGGQLSERLQLDGEARSVVEGVAEAGTRPLPAWFQRRRRLLDSALVGALRSRSRGELVGQWLRGSAVVRARIEAYANALRGLGADITGDDLQAAGVAPGPAIRVGLQAAATARLDERANGERQLEAAVAAIRTWRCPAQRRRCRPASHQSRP